MPTAICSTLWLKSMDWNGVKKINILNETKTQGYTFQGGENECEEIAVLKTEDSKAYVWAKTDSFISSRTTTSLPNKKGKLNCYDIGFKYGKCSGMSFQGKKCDPSDDIVIPTECRDKNETNKGINEGVKSVK